MTQGERNEIILSEIEIAKNKLVENPRLCGFGSLSDVFELSNGKKAQIHITVTTDESEFEEPTNSFIQ